MVFKTKLIGQNYIEDIFNKILDDSNDIPHIFISGCNGSGKTTLLKEFIETYFTKHSIKNKSEWIMNLSSEKDRGIHCVRQNVTEFVHHTSAKQGVYRWILIDDADSLPMISQQALRRPMETHAHTTRFFICSRYSSDLIPPIRSRCLHIEIESISPFDLIDHFLKENNNNNNNQILTPESYSFLMTLVKSPSQIKSIIQVLSNYYKNKEVINVQDINFLFGSPNYSFSIEILRAYLKKDDEKLFNLFFKIWSTGISYEDFLQDLNIYSKQLGILQPKIDQMVHYFIMKGWIQFAQGKTQSFDILRLLIQQ
jgi:DNA polymerase III delta prime subunit